MLINQWDTFVIPDDLVVFSYGDHRLVSNPALASWVKLTAREYTILAALVHRHPCETVVDHFKHHFAVTDEAAKLQIQKILGFLLLKWIIYVPDHIPEIPAPQPHLRQVYYAITEGCNLRCPYCYACAEQALSNELTTAEACQLVDQAANLGCETLILTGGEPLLRRDLFDIAAQTRACGMSVKMITNGTLIKTQAIADRIATHFDHVTVSIDGGTAEIHEQTRGKGTFQIVMRAVALLNAAGVSPTVNHVVTPKNVNYLHTLKESLSAYTIHLVRLMYQGPLGRGTHTSYWSWDNYLKVQQFIWGTPNAHAILPDAPKPPKPGVVKGNCGLGGNEIYITSLGDVYPCKLITNPTFKAGNIREHPLRTIYTQSATFDNLRTSSTQEFHGCATCYIRGSCGGGCRAFHMGYSGDLHISASAEWCPILRHQMVSAMWAAHGVNTVQLSTEARQAYEPILIKTGQHYPIPDASVGGTTSASSFPVIRLHTDP